MKEFEKEYVCILCFSYRTRDKAQLLKHIKDHKHVLMVLTFPFYVGWHVSVKIIGWLLPPKKYPHVLSRSMSVEERSYKLATIQKREE